jgi:hypothetical protein
MQKFIPFEDDWDALENLRPEDLIPFRVSLLSSTCTAARRPDPAMPSVGEQTSASGRDAARRAG